jgi:lipopolysaccharide/colanic/teichoic acid biosynthesis glycosyltransferase
MYRRFVKRPADIITSITLLIILSPISLVTSAVIWLTSGKPILFKQHRTGYKGKKFTIYKYRTMHASNSVHDLSVENQITKVGKWIRTLSIDEIPQLLNILQGEMSFIGPRPWLPEYFEAMTEEQRRRHDVLPGITGLAQAKGRNSLSIHDKIRYDLEYVENISAIQDLKIIFMTIASIFRKEDVHIDTAGIRNELDALIGQNNNLIQE